MRVFLGTLWSSVKQIKAPYVFHWEYRIVLHTMQGKLGLISQGGGSLMVFPELRREPGVYSPVTERMAIQNWCLFTDVRTPV